MKNLLKRISINGLDCMFIDPFSVLDLVSYFGFNPNVIVIDYNGYILETKSWKTTKLQQSDSIEILSMAGGG